MGTLPSLLPPNGHHVGCGGGSRSLTRIDIGSVETHPARRGCRGAGAGGKHCLSVAVVENKGERRPTVPRTEKIKNETDDVVGFSPIAASLRAIKAAGREGATGSPVSTPREAAGSHDSVFITPPPSWEPGWLNDEDMDYPARRSLKHEGRGRTTAGVSRRTADLQGLRQINTD